MFVALHAIKMLGLPPPFLHTTSDQKLEAGMAWEQGNQTIGGTSTESY